MTTISDLLRAAKAKLTPTADRPEFRRQVAKLVGDLGVEVGEPEAAEVIICARAADFDPASNVLWELDANKSKVLPDVRCSTCKEVVVLSNHAYASYTAMDKKPRICCGACVPALLNEQGVP